MKLAFVVPAFNEEALIGGCLESIRAEIQRAGVAADTEIIVVDNASTDATGAVASAVPGVRVVREPKKGLVNARAAGLAATQAELVANIDADTRLPPGWLTTVLDAFAASPRLVVLSGPFVYTDLTPAQRLVTKCFYGAGYAIHAVFGRLLRKGAMVQGGNFVLKRQAWLSVGGFDQSIAFYGEDTDVANRLAPVGEVRWTFDLPIHASGRRLAAEGVVTTGARYALNYFWVTLFGHPISRAYRDIRPS